MNCRYRPTLVLECAVSCGQNGSLLGEGRLLEYTVPAWARSSSQALAPGDYLQLRLYLSAHEKPLAVSLAAVRWARGAILGVEVILMDVDDQAKLDQFVDRHVTIASDVVPWKEEIIITAAG